jgi:hypothetical protein
MDDEINRAVFALTDFYAWVGILEFFKWAFFYLFFLAAIKLIKDSRLE